MAATLEPIRRITLAEIKDARQRIANTILRTPLVRLELGSDFPDVRLKLENLQCHRAVAGDEIIIVERMNEGSVRAGILSIFQRFPSDVVRSEN